MEVYETEYKISMGRGAGDTPPHPFLLCLKLMTASDVSPQTPGFPGSRGKAPGQTSPSGSIPANDHFTNRQELKPSVSN